MRLHAAITFPHQGACGACHDERRCNYCGEKTPFKAATGFCTNGRCMICHSEVCTSGGVTSEGHGFGRQGIDWRKAER